MLNKKYHYTYMLEDTEPIGTEKFYIGVRSCNCYPKEDNYFGSSKHLPKDLKNHCRKFILGVFESRELALENEVQLHKLFMVDKNLRFYNRARQTSVGFCFDCTGRNVSEETRKKISEGNKGKIISEEVRKKMSEGNKGKVVSEETKTKLSELNRGKNNPMFGRVSPMNGKHHSEDTKKRLRENPNMATGGRKGGQRGSSEAKRRAGSLGGKRSSRKGVPNSK